MIDRLPASLTRTVTQLIHYAATDVYLPSMLSNTAPKQRQFTAGCAPAQWVRSHRLATWLLCGTRTCMQRVWMTSNRRSRFPRTVCLETELTRFTSVAFQPAMLC